MVRYYLRRFPTRLCLKAQGFPFALNFDKIDLIDYTYRQCQPAPASFADLGGVWNVDGAYTFYILRTYGAKHAFLVDTDFTDTVIKKGQRLSNLELVQGNFGEAQAAERIGAVNAILLFDVLLHQVTPDWDEILEMYSERTRFFVIYNQQWLGSEKTVRLLDLGREEYLKNVPHDETDPNYRDLFERMYDLHPQHKRIWRDIHNVWQWGITDADLLATMERLGFGMLYRKNCGRFGSLHNFENHAFVFQKLNPPAP